MPSLSIVIATYRRHALLRRVLDRLAGQRAAGGEFEVVVAADAKEGRSDELSAVVHDWPFEVELVAAATPGVSAARNAGWMGASAPLVLFIGDDMLPGPTLVAEHLAWHQRHRDEEVAVLGRVIWARELPLTPFMEWLDHGVQFDYPAIRGADAGWGRFYTANVSLKRELLERSGGFDEDFAFPYEDLELAYRLNELGMRLLYNPAALAEHLHPPTIRAWRDRMALMARAERQFVEKHPDVEPYFFKLCSWADEKPRLWGQGKPYLRYWQALARPFLESWASAGDAGGHPRALNSRRASATKSAR